MQNKAFFDWCIAILAVSILTVHSTALVFFLYFYWRWLDIVMHAAGGIFIGLLALYLYYYSGRITARHFGVLFPFLLSLGAASFVGIGWEFFEFSHDVLSMRFLGRPAFPIPLSLPDTLADLFFDLSGAFIAFIMYVLLWKKSSL